MLIIILWKLTDNKIKQLHIEEPKLMSEIEKMSAQLKGKTIILVCEYGELSHMWAKILTDKGYKVFSLFGGITKWSEYDYPRVSDTCPIRRAA